MFGSWSGVRLVLVVLASLAVLHLGACGGSSMAPEHDASDSGARLDAGAIDAGGDIPDASDAPDASSSCGTLGQPCCVASMCSDGLSCLGGTTCSCARTLFGIYLLRTDGKLLYEAEPPSTAQTPIREDGPTGSLLSDVKDVMEGVSHGCAVRESSGTAWCWRTVANGNALGQLGNGTFEPSGPLHRASQVLTSAATPLTGVRAISRSTASSGSAATCAVTQDGKLYCWGRLTFIANGGTTLNSEYATLITADGVNPFTGVMAVALDNTYACALVQGPSSREVWCWGSNTVGNLGTGDTTLRRYPTRVSGLTDPSKVLTFGYAGNLFFNNGTSCVLDQGRVYCWGANNLGQVGNGTTNTPILAPSPVTFMGGSPALENIVDIQGGGRINPGYQDICALTPTREALCWGSPFQTYPTLYPFAEITTLGSLDLARVRFLTSDGRYHILPTNGSAATTRDPSCGPLE